MSDHPPIPPNCILAGFAYPKAASSGISESVVLRVTFGVILKPLEDDSGILWRKVWADVARCAWLDEAERLWSELESMCQRNISRYEISSKSPDIESTGALRLEIEAAENNALAWKKWSEQK
jgi:hypothetical protein